MFVVRFVLVCKRSQHEVGFDIVAHKTLRNTKEEVK